MSASDAAPLPRLGEVFFDVRGDSRSMRLSWYADTGVAVFSIWQGGTCTGTFRLPIADLPRMVEALRRGPGGGAAEGTGDQPLAAGPHRPGPASAPRALPDSDIETGQRTAAFPGPPPVAGSPYTSGGYLDERPAGRHAEPAADYPTGPAQPGYPREPGGGEYPGPPPDPGYPPLPGYATDDGYPPDPRYPDHGDLGYPPGPAYHGSPARPYVGGSHSRPDDLPGGEPGRAQPGPASGTGNEPTADSFPYGPPPGGHPAPGHEHHHPGRR